MMKLFNFKCFSPADDHSIPQERVTTIVPSSGWQMLNIKELIEYRELFGFLVWRDIKVLYAQTILGLFWAILQPLIQIVIFTMVFGKVAKVPTGDIPYLLFSTTGIIPWTYISQGMSESSQSLIKNQGMLGKIYFPRLIFPFVPVLAKLVDFSISLILLAAIAIYYHIYPSWSWLFLPLFLIMMVATTASVGMWLSALAIRFRDVKHAMPLVIRMLMFTAPIVYSASSIKPAYRLLYSLNPLVGIIEGFRASLLSQPIPWESIWPGMISALILFFSAAYYFKRMESTFVDVL